MTHHSCLCDTSCVISSSLGSFISYLRQLPVSNKRIILDPQFSDRSWNTLYEINDKKDFGVCINKVNKQNECIRKEASSNFNGSGWRKRFRIFQDGSSRDGWRSALEGWVDFLSTILRLISRLQENYANVLDHKPKWYILETAPFNKE